MPQFSELLAKQLRVKITKLVESQNIKYSFFLAGLGSFGNCELSFGSDIDLIVVVEDFKKAKQADQDFQNLLQILRKEIPQFEIDFRLRPEGKSSPLVIEIAGYEKYINNRMRIWEFQALSKTQFICGNENLFNQFINIRNEQIKNIDPLETAGETFAAYKAKLNFGISSNQKINLKSNSGALLTIDTIVQLFLMLNHKFYNESYKLNGLEKLRLVSQKIAEEYRQDLIDNYIYLKNAQIAIQNLMNQKKSTMPNDKNKVALLATYLKEPDNQILLEKIKSILNTNTNLFNKIKSDNQIS
ncbi:MAG: hypothetical protein U5K00_11500 [Melioribacteraceae bacterium]|nr:hypothetical protein [Melioribacteraceae bacterium]